MRALALLCSVVFASASHAAMQHEVRSYKVGDTTMEGHLYFDDAQKALPGLVFVPNWMGINAANLAQAKLVASRGYVVFVADMYGKTVRPTDGAAAGKASGVVKGDRTLMRKRVLAALDQLKASKAPLNTKQLGAIGFCFGGTSVLELARAGAAVGGVVSFHGGLSSPTPADAKNISSKVLVLHGADDPNVPPAEVAAFEQEMKSVPNLDWQLVSYGGAVHSFTDPDANSPGRSQYNPLVAKRAFAAMDAFYAEIFAK